MLEADVEPAGQTVEAERQPEMESQDLNAEVIRLTLELHEATEEKLQAARYGLVVLDENEALKTKHRQLEEEYEALKAELQQLREVRTRQFSIISKHKAFRWCFRDAVDPAVHCDSSLDRGAVVDCSGPLQKGLFTAESYDSNCITHDWMQSHA